MKLSRFSSLLILLLSSALALNLCRSQMSSQERDDNPGNQLVIFPVPTLAAWFRAGIAADRGKFLGGCELQVQGTVKDSKGTGPTGQPRQREWLQVH